MGQLTAPDTALMDSGGNVAAMGAPGQMRDKLIKSSANFKPFADGSTTPGQSPMHNLGIGTPNLQQAATAGAPPGGTNAMSPGLNKAGKLVTLLTAGLQGAMAGRSSSEQAVQQSGGRRSGGVGQGFEAGLQMPWQREMQQGQLQQQQAQTGALKAQSELIQTPNGPIPAWLAKTVMPAQIRGAATENAADTRAGATTEAAQTRAGAQVQGAQIGAGARVQGAQIGADARVKAAQMGLGPLAAVSPELQQQLGLPAQLPLKMLNQAESAANKPLTTVAGENDSYVVNKQTGQKTPLGVGNRGAGAVNAGLVPVADPTDPGNVTYQRRGSAVGAQSPQGAGTQAAKTEARSEVPTKIGDQKVAFNTAIAHADLLRKASKALDNGDVQALNQLKNAWRNAFGDARPITAQTIADAYGGEITNMIAKGHITDKEMEKTGRTIDPNSQNYETVDSVLNAYQSLAKSKLNMLTQQANSAKSGGKTAPNDPLGIRR